MQESVAGFTAAANPAGSARNQSACLLKGHTTTPHLRHVQDILGLRSLNSTEHCLRLTITDLKEAHRKFHPPGRGGASTQS